MMRLWLLQTALLASLALACVVVRAQTPVIGPDEGVGFDYLTAALLTDSVTEFQAQWDGGDWGTLGLPPAVVLPDTPDGAQSYAVPIPFPTGQHTVAFRACNPVGCGGASDPFRLRAAKRAAERPDPRP
jgi:hypothetical protein